MTYLYIIFRFSFSLINRTPVAYMGPLRENALGITKRRRSPWFNPITSESSYEKQACGITKTLGSRIRTGQGLAGTYRVQ